MESTSLDFAPTLTWNHQRRLGLNEWIMNPVDGDDLETWNQLVLTLRRGLGELGVESTTTWVRDLALGEDGLASTKYNE
jgi:hypothetical protein